MRTIIAALAVVILSGCSSYKGVVIPEALQCQPTAELLKSCDLPAEIKESVTYADLIRLMQQDRQNLLACGLRQEYLVKEINRCNEEIAKYNERIQGINATLKQR